MMSKENRANEIIELILQHLAPQPRSESVDDDSGFWTNGDEILCPSEMECEIVASFLEDILSEWSTMTVHTGYYDPSEDGAEADANSGFYYISFD